VANIGLEQRQLVIAHSKRIVLIKQLTAILVRRRLLIIGVSCTIMAVASLLALMAKPMYQSSMQIQVSSNLYKKGASTHVQGSDGEVSDIDIEFVDYNPQLRLMLSSTLIGKAVDLLRSEYPNITVEHIKGKKGHQESLVVTQLEEETEANQGFSQVFEVSYKDNNPTKTQKVLQALQKVYHEHNIEQQKERFVKGLSFINERLPKVKQEMTQAQKKLENFRNKYNLVDPEVQGKILAQSLADIRKQLQITRAQLKDVQARYNHLQQELAFSPQDELVSSKPSDLTRYQTLLDEIQKTEEALAKERLRYTDNFPTVQKLIQQRQTQLTLLSKEISQEKKDKPIATTNTEESLLTKVHMVGSDVKLIENLLEVQTATKGLRANEKSLAESEEQIRTELSKYPGLIAEYNRLMPEVETHRKTLEQLEAARQSMGIKIAQAGFDWQVLEEPYQGIYLGSSKFLFLVTGALIAPILGVAAALMWEIWRDAIYSSEDLQNLTNLPLLATIPKLPKCHPKKRVLSLPFDGWRNLAPNLLQALSFSKQLDLYTGLPFHEALDIAYQNIQILNSPVPCKSLMLASALSQEGKTTIALGLAVSAARMHQRVLLIDANLRKPNLHKVLALSNDWGLSLLLLEETNTAVGDYIQPIHPFIDILTAGPIPEDTVKLLTSRRMKELLELFERTYDLVLIDTSPLLGTVDARIIASMCNGIAMVSRVGWVSSTELTQATEILNKLNLIGIIANLGRDGTW
jgi:succinoglycan biosynthesis transport protein ExoP